MRAGRVGLLVRLFTRRFFENDLLAPDIDLRPSAIYLLVLLMTPSFLWSVKGIVRFGLMSIFGYEVVETASWFDKSLLVTLAMLNGAIVTLLCWEALLVDRRDALVLGALPLRPRTIVIAKAAALSRMFAIVAALNVPAAVILSVAIYSHFSGTLVFRALLAHVVAATAATMTACLLLTVVLVAVTSVLTGRTLRLVTVGVQGAVLVASMGLLLGLQWAPLVARVAQEGDVASIGWLSAWPPLWFVGLYQVVLGVEPGRVLFEQLAGRALVLSAAALCAGVPLTLALWRRTFATQLTSVQAESAGSWRLSRFLVTALVRRPFDRALLQFFFSVLARSPRHRLTMLTGAGVAVTVAIQGVLILMTRTSGGTRWLTEFAVPLLALFVLLACGRWLLALPAELPASWILALTTPAPAAGVRRVTQRLFLVLVTAPVVVLAFAFSWWQADVRSAAAHAALMLVVSLGLVELTVARVTALPFAAEYVADRGNLKARWPVHVFVLLWIVPLLAAGGRALLAQPGHAFVVVTLLFGAGVFLAYHRRRGRTDVVGTDPGTAAEWRAIELRIGSV